MTQDNTTAATAYLYRSIKFFEGLNALRFFAAFLVVIHHAETIRRKNGLFNFEWLSLFRNGGNAVNFFFVLSGFLITYLLLKENEQTKTISIKTFYLKRVLRIWPLYFLLVALGTLILPVVFQWLHIDYDFPYTFGESWYYFVFFLPAMVTYHFGSHLLQPLWSIGVEEVFYLIWAPLIKFLKKHVLAVLLTLIVVKITINFLVYPLGESSLAYYMVNHCFTFEDMAIGGLGAYFLFHRKNDISHLSIYAKPFQLLFYGLLLIYIVFDKNIEWAPWRTVFGTPVFSRLIYDFLFLYLIIGISLNKNNLFKIRNKHLSYLGEISYGIYMYHMLVIFGIVLILKNWLATMNGYVASIIFFTLLTVGVITVSAISKKWFENYFLRLKSKF